MQSMETATLRVSTITRVLGLASTLGAFVLVVSLFLDWFEVSDAEESEAFTGWSALELTDGAFVLLLLVALWFVFSGTRTDTKSQLLSLGVAAAVMVTVILATDTPTIRLVEVGGEASSELKGGAFLAVGGAALMLISGIVDAILSSSAQRDLAATGHDPAAPTAPPQRG